MMSNMIGKISGMDWSKAPEGAKFVDMEYRIYVKGEFGYWWSDGRYVDNLNLEWGTDRYISKEEDLGLNTKVVKSFDDVEVGMFFKSVTDKVRLVTYKERSSFGTILMLEDMTYEWAAPNGVLSGEFHSWSYIYNGEYQLVQREPEETETQKQLNKVKASL